MEGCSEERKTGEGFKKVDAGGERRQIQRIASERANALSNSSSSALRGAKNVGRAGGGGAEQPGRGGGRPWSKN